MCHMIFILKKTSKLYVLVNLPLAKSVILTVLFFFCKKLLTALLNFFTNLPLYYFLVINLIFIFLMLIFTL